MIHIETWYHVLKLNDVETYHIFQLNVWFEWLLDKDVAIIVHTEVAGGRQVTNDFIHQLSLEIDKKIR